MLLPQTWRYGLVLFIILINIIYKIFINKLPIYNIYEVFFINLVAEEKKKKSKVLIKADSYFTILVRILKWKSRQISYFASIDI